VRRRRRVRLSFFPWEHEGPANRLAVARLLEIGIWAFGTAARADARLWLPTWKGRLPSRNDAAVSRLFPRPRLLACPRPRSLASFLSAIVPRFYGAALALARLLLPLLVLHAPGDRRRVGPRAAEGGPLAEGCNDEDWRLQSAACGTTCALGEQLSKEGRCVLPASVPGSAAWRRWVDCSSRCRVAHGGSAGSPCSGRRRRFPRYRLKPKDE